MAKSATYLELKYTHPPHTEYTISKMFIANKYEITKLYFDFFTKNHTNKLLTSSNFM